MSNFFNDIVSGFKDDAINFASDGGSAEFEGYIDTGCHILNAVMSGSIYDGIPNNKITAFAGEPATGKTFFVLNIIKHFLDSNEDAAVFYFDTEAAVTKDMIESRGIDSSRIIIVEPVTVQEFRHKALQILDRYIESGKDRPPMMFALDSLGQLSTTKEIEDTAEGKETKDMTRAGIIKSAFRVLNLKLAKAKVPMLVTNHVYDSMGSMFPTKELAGGSGLKYTASQIVMLSKRKDKEGTEVVGNIIHCKMFKSRFTRENAIVDVKLSYKKGLSPYYGLLELAEKYGIFKKVSTRYELPDGSKTFGKTINNNPEKYFTPEILDQINAVAKTEFCYGEIEDEEEFVDDETLITEEANE